MSESTSSPAGRIFISYRRDETGYAAGWLYDRLTDRFGGGQVFKDVDSIQLGDDFVEVITRAVGACDVLLALIGDRWSTITDEQGQRRLDDRDDFVRLEIEAALTRQVRVIPILVDGARMPTADELPESLVTLVRRQSLELSPTRFEFDTNRLLKVLDSTLAEVRAAHRGAVQDVRPATGATPLTTNVAASGPAEPSTLGPASNGEPRLSVPGPAAEKIGPTPETRRPPLSAQVRMLIAAGAGAVLVLLIVVIVLVVTRSGTSSSPNASAVDGRGQASPAGGIGVDATPVTSGDGIKLTGLTVSPDGPPRLGDTITVSYSLTNMGAQPIQVDFTFVGARNAADENKDTEDMNEGETLEPGETISATGRVFLDSAGRWDVWPCYALTNGNFCPDKWQVVSFLAS
jgi:TIR domain